MQQCAMHSTIENMKRIVVGIAAHVDAGKTTCIESMLYKSGTIRKAGCVDHRDTVLDFDEEERKHGITIYAKDARIIRPEEEIYVIDTPGHVDFSAEMERVLSVLDMAVLVINGQDGVQSHTETIWRCLRHYEIPCIIFVNKMDISHRTKEELMKDLLQHCSKDCIDWMSDEKEDALSMVNETIMEDYLENGTLDMEHIQAAFTAGEFFPVIFGSALKHDQTDRLLDTICALSTEKEYSEEFGAKVFRISKDANGDVLTHVKITGGILKAKQKIGEDQKADQIRIYTGAKYETVPQAEAGMVCTLKGLSGFEPGQGLGMETDSEPPLLNAYLDYKLLLPKGADVLALSDVCAQLAAEDPQLNIDVDPDKHAIHVRIMGEMQMEVLQKKIEERSGISVGFGTGGIVYEETIKEPVIGVGHFEPLRHYAEVVVRLEPQPRGSGISVVSEVSRGSLSAVWERSILSLLERRHRGVLTCSTLTDVKIVLMAAKGSLKHTSGGDFRQAAQRAVRQALMKTDSILLEPYYDFTITLPNESLSRCLYEMEQRSCTVEIEAPEGDMQVVHGQGPVRTMLNYTKELTTYTKGRGRYRAELLGYMEVMDQDKIIADIGYDPENDMRNPCGSVFCANGAGYYVPWMDVEKHMHIDLKKEETTGGYRHMTMKVDESELSGILSRASSNNKNDKKHVKPVKKKDDEREHVEIKETKQKMKVMIVDGYNCLYAWDSLQDEEDLSVARGRLIDLVFAYQAYYKAPIILVFDGYKRKENSGSCEKRGGMEIVYTRTDMTADAWIEKKMYEWKGKAELEVVTSDALIQNAALAAGARRISVREFEQNVRLRTGTL